MNDECPIVIGLGCSTAATAGEIIALVAACLLEARCDAGEIAAFATHSRKLGSHALIETAAHFGVPLRFLDDEDLTLAGTCEAVAAVAGPLLLDKRKSSYATCAIAACAPHFDLARFGQCASPSAAIAPATVSTSMAAP